VHEKLVTKSCCRDSVTSGDEDRVVAGDGARDARMSGLVDSLRERVRIAGRCRQHDEVSRSLNCERIPANRGA
jgi:hypothetical protein